MSNEYYVILDRIHLNFMNNGTIVGIENAERFKSYESAVEELKNYKNVFEYAIYKVTEKMFRDFELIENEIDIKKIPELLIEQLKDKGFTNADIYMLAQQQNNLLQAIKQLDKRLEKLEE